MGIAHRIQRLGFVLLATFTMASIGLVVTPAAGVGQSCKCDEFNGGHNCSGWDGNHDCDHDGFVHSSCDVHPGCIVGVTMLQRLDETLNSAMADASRSGDPRFVAVALAGVKGEQIPRFQFAWRTEKIRVLDCDGETVRMTLLPAIVGTYGLEG